MHAVLKYSIQYISRMIGATCTCMFLHKYIAIQLLLLLLLLQACGLHNQVMIEGQLLKDNNTA